MAEYSSADNSSSDGEPPYVVTKKETLDIASPLPDTDSDDDALQQLQQQYNDEDNSEQKLDIGIDFSEEHTPECIAEPEKLHLNDFESVQTNSYPNADTPTCATNNSNITFAMSEFESTNPSNRNTPTNPSQGQYHTPVMTPIPDDDEMDEFNIEPMQTTISAVQPQKSKTLPVPLSPSPLQQQTNEANKTNNDVNTIKTQITPPPPSPSPPPSQVPPVKRKMVEQKCKDKPLPKTPETAQESSENDNNLNKKNDNSLDLVQRPYLKENVKFVSFIAKVQTHAVKQRWKTFNYNCKGYEVDSSMVLNKMGGIDSKEMDGNMTIDGDKLFIFKRNMFIKNAKSDFNYEMALRTNNDNELDAIKLLDFIINSTKSKIYSKNVENIENFNFDHNFDSIMQQLRKPLPFNPVSFVSQ